MFSVDQWLSPPPLSLLLSIFLIAGLDYIGALFLKKIGLLIQNAPWIRWQGPAIGAMLLTSVIYPLVLTNLSPKFFFQLVAVFCAALGLLHLYRAIIQSRPIGKRAHAWWSIFKKCSVPKKLLISIMLGMGFISMSPETSADALDYHLGMAIAILNNGGMPITPEWFMGRLSGNGEVLNAIGISIGAEQLGSILQYMSLVGIVAIVHSPFQHTTFDNSQRRVFELLALAAVSVPVLLFLVGSAKPQLWPIALTTIAFTLTVHPRLQNMSRTKLLVNYGIVCALVMTASQAKFSYLLGGGIVGLLATLLMVKKRYFIWTFVIAFGVAAIILAPPVLWKKTVYNANWLTALLKPWPGDLPGTAEMDFAIRYLMNGDSFFPFPFSIFLPASAGQFTTVMGVSGIILIGLRPGKNVMLWLGIISAIGVAFINIAIAPKIARMYLEPYFWLLIVVALQPAHKIIKHKVWLSWPIYAQAATVLIAAWVGVALLFPGALLPSWRANIMQRVAVDYTIMNWADSVLPKHAILLNGQRSMALAPRDAISTEWMSYIDAKDPNASVYLERIKSKNVSHILISGADFDKHMLVNCFGKLIAGPGTAYFSTRNPFNKGGAYSTWVLEFHSEKLPECAK